MSAGAFIECNGPLAQPAGDCFTQILGGVVAQAGVALGLVGVVGHGIGVSHILALRGAELLLPGILEALGEGHPLVHPLEGHRVQLIDAAL